MLNVGDIITLNDNKKYAVVSLTNYNNNFYVYIANMDNPTDTQIVLHENNQFIVINDESLIDELESIFSGNNI